MPSDRGSPHAIQHPLTGTATRELTFSGRGSPEAQNVSGYCCIRASNRTTYSRQQSILNHSGKHALRSQSGNWSNDMDGSLTGDRHDDCDSIPDRQGLLGDIHLRWILAWQLCPSRRIRVVGSTSHRFSESGTGQRLRECLRERPRFAERVNTDTSLPKTGAGEHPPPGTVAITGSQVSEIPTAIPHVGWIVSSNQRPAPVACATSLAQTTVSAEAGRPRLRAAAGRAATRRHRCIRHP